jgi:hypothetical protein
LGFFGSRPPLPMSIPPSQAGHRRGYAYLEARTNTHLRGERGECARFSSVDRRRVLSARCSATAAFG